MFGWASLVRKSVMHEGLRYDRDGSLVIPDKTMLLNENDNGEKSSTDSLTESELEEVQEDDEKGSSTSELESEDLTD